MRGIADAVEELRARRCFAEVTARAGFHRAEDRLLGEIYGEHDAAASGNPRAAHERVTLRADRILASPRSLAASRAFALATDSCEDVPAANPKFPPECDQAASRRGFDSSGESVSWISWRSALV